MARSVQSIKESMQKKREEIERLELAEIEAQKAYEKKMAARKADNQALMLGQALMAQKGDADVKALLKRVHDAWPEDKQAEFVKSGEQLEADAQAAAEERAAERWAKMTPEQREESEQRKAEREAERAAKKEAKKAANAAKKAAAASQAA